MTPLLPGFRDQLEVRAQQLEDGHAPRRRLLRGPRRLHGRGLAVAILLAATGVSGAAYAARDLWRPQLGDGHRGRATATASELPADQLKAFGVLRRHQNGLDRGAASRFALRLSADGGLVRTNAVRRLATGQNGGAIVLVPFLKKPTIDIDAIRRAGRNAPSTPPMITKTDEVCLTVLDSFDSAGVTCADTDDMLAGRLGMATSTPQCLEPIQRRYFRKAQASERRLAESEGRPATRLRCTHHGEHGGLYSVGVVPDGVAAVRLGRAPGSAVVPVHDNLWQTGPGQGRAVEWLDAGGRVLSQHVADTRRRLALPPR